jgi:hypothetical protein
MFTGALSNIHAQFAEPSITFSKTSHNFGNINEQDGVKIVAFEFTNGGSQPLILNEVVSSCGCTVPEYSREPIPAGGKGSIKVSYDPMGRPGAFRKSVTVKSNAREGVVTLYIVGLVNPKPRTVADDFPVVLGKLRASTNHLAMQTVYKNKTKTDTLEIYNDSDSIANIEVLNPPKHLALTIEPKTLAPKQKGRIIVTFDGTASSDWGFVLSRIFLAVNGKQVNENMLAVSATLEEDFSKMTPEARANAPKGVLSEESYNFGTITQGEKINHDFYLKNEGKDPLVIRKISTTCGCTASAPDKYEIPGGDQAVLKCSFDSRGKAGKQFQTVTIILNDPAKSTQVIRFIGTVENPGK